MLQSPAAPFQEQSFSRDAEDLRGFLDAAVRLLEGVADEHLLERLDGERQGLMHTFDSSGRMALGAISYIYPETRSRSLLIQAFHTFPDDCAIVKSQSVFELP